MSRAITFLIASALSATACGALSTPVRLEARPGDLAALVGDWHGEYVAFGTPGRHGTISFTLAANDERASGSVVMIPQGSHDPYTRYRGEREVAASREFSILTEVLTITVVRVEESMVRGEMDPYWDPDRQCVAFTKFYGFIQGRTIEGTFKTSYSMPFTETTGRWHVIKADTRPQPPGPSRRGSERDRMR